MTTPHEYTDKDIEVLEGLDAVRKRPGMYIGGTDKRGFHHLLWEVVDNSVDEALAGFANRIEVTLNADGSATVADNGRGIPMTPKETGTFKGVPTVELVATVLHAGGKFNGSAYQYSGGLHGVGLSVVNALSESMSIDVVRDGKSGHIEFGVVATDDGVVKCAQVTSPLAIKDVRRKSDHGTTVTFKPDPTVFTSYRSGEWDVELVSRRLKQAAFLNAGLTFILKDSREDYDRQEITYHYDNGIQDFMSEVANDRLDTFAQSRQVDRESLTPYPPQPVVLGGSDSQVQGEWNIALQWFPDTAYKYYAFANGIETPDGGTHVAGYQQVLTSILNRYASQEHIGLLSADGWKLEAQDVQSGLGVVVSVKVKEPQFDGQTKSKLNNEETRQMVRSGFQQQMWSWLEENPTQARTFVEKLVRDMEIRRKAFESAEAARAKAVSTALKPKSAPIPGKLRDCQKHGKGAELFIVEGDSAGGSAASARDPQTQAILAIRGKVLNIEKVLGEKDSAEKLQANNEVQGIIASIGAGSQELFDIDAMRYERIVLMTDADDDGRHIELLLMTLFHRLFPGLIESGRLLVARPPLFAAATKHGKTYLSNADELDAFLATKQGRGAHVTRFKGLGEMNGSQLKETAMSPQTRRLARIDIPDDVDADSVISSIMGKNTDYRWELVLSHANPGEYE